MVKRLLIATDLSPRSDRALDRAVLVARQKGAELLVLHVVDDDLPSSVAERRKTEAAAVIRQHLASAPHARGLNVTVTVVYGEAANEIPRAAEDCDADLIVLGAHHEETLRNLFIGPTDDRVLRYGSRPVLLVKDRAHEIYRRIVVATDFSEPARRALEFALGFVPDGEFYIAHAFDIPFLGSGSPPGQLSKSEEQVLRQKVAQKMDAFLEGLSNGPSHIKCVVQPGGVRQVVLAQIERVHAQLLVVGTSGRTGLAHILLGSTAGELLRQPPCDVLGVR